MNLVAATDIFLVAAVLLGVVGVYLLALHAPVGNGQTTPAGSSARPKPSSVTPLRPAYRTRD
jgi:hypothetical protein